MLLATQPNVKRSKACSIRVTFNNDLSLKQSLMIKDRDMALVLSGLIKIFVKEIRVAIKHSTPSDFPLRQVMASRSKVFEAALDLGKIAFDIHQENSRECFHITQLMMSFIDSMDELLDAILGFPNKPAYESRPSDIDFEIVNQIAGLRALKPNRGVNPRVIKPVNRDGSSKITLKEIANLFRVEYSLIKHIEKGALKKIQRSAPVRRMALV